MSYLLIITPQPRKIIQIYHEVPRLQHSQKKGSNYYKEIVMTLRLISHHIANSTYLSFRNVCVGEPYTIHTYGYIQSTLTHTLHCSGCSNRMFTWYDHITSKFLTIIGAKALTCTCRKCRHKNHLESFFKLYSSFPFSIFGVSCFVFF